jgi:L-alanine-DL-glutamate epimerase-like enolase superfamily enzyme
MAKGANQPLYRYLGGVSGTVEIDMTIGIDTPEKMAQKATRLVKEGYRHIKVKAGVDDDQDKAAIRLIRQAAPNAHLKVDANQGWTAHRALAMLRVYAQEGVEALEQPVPYWDLAGLQYVRERSPLPIMADEGCFSTQDAAKIAKAGAADVINIKLMKCGGLYRALQINAIAEASGINCMLGCMLESRLSIAAGAALVASHPNFIYADLDSFLEFSDTSLLRSGFDYQTPMIHLSEKPGIGEELIF